MHSAVGVTHRYNLDLLQAAAVVIKTLRGLIAAGFNCTPAELEATGWPKLIGGKVIAPQLAIVSGSPYMACGAPLGPGKMTVGPHLLADCATVFFCCHLFRLGRVLSQPCSDHIYLGVFMLEATSTT